MTIILKAIIEIYKNKVLCMDLYIARAGLHAAFSLGPAFHNRGSATHLQGVESPKRKEEADVEMHAHCVDTGMKWKHFALAQK